MAAKLSLTIPTYNEEGNIRIPLDSAYDLVDEVVIVDGGSTDTTVEIAESYGEKVMVHHVDNPPNFLKNKQRGIEFATGEWILQLDADEAVSPELAAELKELVASGGTQSSGEAGSNQGVEYAGFNLPRKNWFLNRYLMKGGVYPDFVTRLYRRDKAHFKLENVHENVIIDGPIGETKEALLHYADPDFERYLTRWNRYTTFDAQQLVDARKQAKTGLSGLDFLAYMVGKPLHWFMLTYFRHRGYADGFPGFVFSLFSAIRFWAIYIKAWQRLHRGDPYVIL
ncbi:MAG: glycosyltransferase family 2 protein [Patescibacteria group bacterium]